MNTYYITFGTNHLDKFGKSLFHCYTTIEAENENKARSLAFHYFDKNWSSIYDKFEKTGIEQFGLIYVPVNMITKRYENYN